jgi:predicted nucleotidyltransferase
VRLDSLPSKVTAAIRSFLTRLREVHPDARVYLYGSFARGDWMEDSDVDLVVVCPAFAGPLVERMAKLRLLAPDTVPFEILAYTPLEMEQLIERRLTWQDIASYWVELTAPDPTLREVSDG